MLYYLLSNFPIINPTFEILQKLLVQAEQLAMQQDPIKKLKTLKRKKNWKNEERVHHVELFNIGTLIIHLLTTRNLCLKMKRGEGCYHGGKQQK